MGLFDFFKKEDKIPEAKEPAIEASSGYYRATYSLSYDGEKNEGELGRPVNYFLDYNALRTRSWQSYLDNDITQTIIRRYITWVIGGGLKLQSEPVESVLKSEGIDVNKEKFSKIVEDRFKLFQKSKAVDYKGIDNLHRIAKVVYKNAIIGGDVLVLLRVFNNNISIQTIDGSHIETPYFSKFQEQALKRGNAIKNGIEQNKKGEHIAYYVKEKGDIFKRIPVKGVKSGKKMVFLVYGLQYRIDNNRGIPLISTTLETLQKLDRYKEATVGSAEERAKIPYTIKHDQNSTGENPMAKNMVKSWNIDGDQDNPVDINGKQLANTAAATFQKQVMNLPVGASLESTDTKSDINFGDFYKPNKEAICSTLQMPPEVAFSKYDSNFSASRAALKDWEHTLSVERAAFSFQFYQNIYDLWLDLQILQNKVQAMGYLNAVASGNEIGLLALREARFIGSSVPHIDPVKEVTAERLKLGSSSGHLPLTTLEAATERLNSGDSPSNMLQFSTELNEADKLGIKEEDSVNQKTE